VYSYIKKQLNLCFKSFLLLAVLDQQTY